MPLVRRCVLGLDAALRGALLIAPAAVALAQSIVPQWQRIREAWLAGRLDRAEHRIVVETFGHVTRGLMRMGQPVQPRGVTLLGALGDPGLRVIAQSQTQTQNQTQNQTQPDALAVAIGEACDEP